MLELILVDTFLCQFIPTSTGPVETGTKILQFYFCIDVFNCFSFIPECFFVFLFGNRLKKTPYCPFFGLANILYYNVLNDLPYPTLV